MNEGVNKGNNPEIRFLPPERDMLSEEAVESYLEKPGTIKWILADDLLGEENDYCVDGREKEPAIATPGGDTALLTEAIIAIGKLANRELNEFEIRKVFRWRVETLGSFYLHTDTHALNNLTESLNNDPTIPVNFSNAQETLKFIRDPEKDLQISLLSHLYIADNVGCGHLKLMLENPKAYGMSRMVIKSLMRGFYNMLWNGSDEEKAKLNFRVLEGDHNEGAVVTILTPGEIIKGKTMVPMIRPTDGETSIFVFHPQMSQFMHKMQAEELIKAGLFPELTKARTSDFQQIMGEILETTLNQTLMHLALDLPKYSVELPYPGES